MNIQKRLASQILKCSQKRIRFDPEKLGEIKEAITKHDVKLLIGRKVITSIPKMGASRARANVIRIQRRKGNRSGHGSRKGSSNARENEKCVWIKKIRKQRALLKRLYENEKIDTKMYRDLYLKSKGNFFRSTRHIKIYLEEHGVLKENEESN